jgi:dihydropteroate synthase
VLADLEGAAGLARIEAAAAVCVWLGASVLRTRHVAEVRRCADMTESILGRRPPAWAVRGLA